MRQTRTIPRLSWRDDKNQAQHLIKLCLLLRQGWSPVIAYSILDYVSPMEYENKAAWCLGEDAVGSRFPEIKTRTGVHLITPVK